MPITRAGVPFAVRETSHDAAVSVADTAAAVRRMVYHHILQAGRYGVTCDELEVEFGRIHETISARVWDLNGGNRRLPQRIVDSGVRRPTRRGRAAIVWVVKTDEGVAKADEPPMEGGAVTVLNTSLLDVDLDIIRAEPPDVMIVDPPYAAHVHASAVSQSIGGGSRSRDLGFDYLSPVLRRRIARFAALTKRWSVIYTDIESLTWWRLSLRAAGATYIRAIPWVRWSMPQLSGDRPTTGCEMLVVAYGSGKGRKHWNGPGNLLSLTHTCLRGDGKHKTEKPLDQLLDLVSYFSDRGETVFDPCAGSGTTGLACKLLGRQFVGLEIDATWATFANARLAGPLSKRDETRLERWRASQAEQAADRARVDAHTADVRAKADAAKEQR